MHPVPVWKRLSRDRHFRGRLGAGIKSRRGLVAEDYPPTAKASPSSGRS